MPDTPQSRRPSQPGPDSKSGEAMRASLERALADATGAGGAFQAPQVPDHRLIHRIGSGAYGEVWLAHNALDTPRAVKVVYRAHFKEDRPYEREFHGILKYEPISRTHEGLVQVLHVGRNDEAGCFYYVMELADSVPGSGLRSPGPSATPGASQPRTPESETYIPRTLHSDLARTQRLPPAEAAQLVLRLTGALAHLHSHGLVHRDIKPSNVIFVGGQPKLADIGLVTDVGSSHSFVGTEGFIPPEGPGTPQADLYGMGKLLYELATGRDRMDFPQLPPLSFLSSSDGEKARVRSNDAEALLELNEVMTRACAPDPKQRYASATELQAELNLFLAGRSLRHSRNIERALARLKHFAAAACVCLALAAGAIWFLKNEERHANERERQASDRARTEELLRQRAEAAETESRQQLYTALLDQARATVVSREMGQRVRALDALRRAGAISNTVELRRQALVALTLPDLRFERELPYDPRFTLRLLDPAFERVALCVRDGPVEIRSTSDQRLLATLPASTNLPAWHTAIWSGDGRFLAVKRDHPGNVRRADWEIWRMADSRRVLLLKDVPMAPVSFHPRSNQLLVSRTGGAVIWDLETGNEVGRCQLADTPMWLRFAPEGERFAALYMWGNGWIVSVHEATNASAAPLASHLFTQVATFNWHPAGRFIAVPEMSGNIHWMDAQTGTTRVLGRHKAEAVRAEFSPDGDYLITGAWSQELICWEVQTLQRAFTIEVNGYLGQFSADGRAYAVATGSGVQLFTFERPGVYREFAEDLGARLAQAAFSPDGRWLAASANKRMGVWDLAAGGAGALNEEAYAAQCYFTPDARELFASRNTQGRDNAAFRWRIAPAMRPGDRPRLEPLPLHKPEQFDSLCLSSNWVVISAANKGTQILAPDEIETGNHDWMPTRAGMNCASPDGRWLGIFRHYAPTLHVHRLPRLEPVARLTHHTNIFYFEFSPAGDEVALYSRAGVEFWSTANWERSRVLTKFHRPFLYAPDARSFWLTKDQRTAGLYDARTLEPKLLLPDGMFPLAVSPDGRRLAVSVDGQRLQAWDFLALREQFRALGLDWENPQ